MNLTPEQAGRLHAILVEALSIMDSVPYVPTDTVPDTMRPPPEPRERVRKPRTDEGDAQVYELVAQAGAPVRLSCVAAGVVGLTRQQVQRALARLKQAGRIAMRGDRRGAEYELAIPDGPPDIDAIL